MLREEDAADGGGDVGEGIADAADYEVGEGGGLADEGGLGRRGREVPLMDELVWELENWEMVRWVVIAGRGWGSRKKGRARMAQDAVRKIPTCISN